MVVLPVSLAVVAVLVPVVGVPVAEAPLVVAVVPVDVGAAVLESSVLAPEVLAEVLVPPLGEKHAAGASARRISEARGVTARTYHRPRAT